jgi:hypothetical protein
MDGSALHGNRFVRADQLSGQMVGPALHGNRFVRIDQLFGQMGVPRSTETDLSVLTSGLGPGCPAKYFCNATSPAPSNKSKNATIITTINQSEDRKSL